MRHIRLDPDHLDHHVEASQRLNEELRDRVQQLLTTYQQVVPEFQWGTVDASSALQALADYLQLNDLDDAWVATIAAAFRQLDGHFPDGVPEDIVADLLREHGLDGGRAEVTFDDPSAFGLPLTSGWIADPVSTATGHLAEVEVDLPLPDSAGPLRSPRVYSSRRSRAGAFGRGWTSWLDVGLDRTDDGAVLLLPDGRQLRFVRVAGRLLAAAPTHLRVHEGGDGFEVVHPDGDRWQLDGEGRLLRVAFAGGAVDLERDTTGAVTALAHDNGRRVEVDRVGGRVAALRSSDGRRVTYAYDRDGDLIRVDGPGCSHRFEVADGLLVAAWDADGVLQFRNTYDDEGRVLTQENAFGRVVRFAYLRPGVTIVDDTDGGPRTTFVHDDHGRLVGVIDDEGAHQTTTYDATGNPVASMDRDGAVTTRLFDDAGRPVRIEGPDGAVTELDYDEVGRIVRRVGPDGGEVRLAYEGDAREPVSVTDAAGATTTCELDEHGRIVAVTDPDGVTSQLERDADGVVTAAEAADGARMTLELDAVGQIVGVVAADGDRTAFTRDDAGRVTSRTTPDGAVTRWARSPAGRVTGSTAPSGAVTNLRYGGHGELAELTDPVGVSLTYGYDQLGHQVKVTDPAGATVRHTYDGLSRLVATTDPTGRTSRREHDPAGRIVALVDPDGARRTRTYDLAGRLTSLSDQLGATTRFAYDVAGRLVSVTDPLDAEATFAYDAVGRRTEARWADGRVTRWTYTPAGRLTSTVDDPGDGVAPSRRTFVYDRAGRLTSVTSRSGDDPGHERTLSLQRDSSGEVVGLTDADGRQVALVRDDAGRVVAIDDGTGPSWTTEFDHAGRPTAVTAPDGGRTSYGYDDAGRLEQVTDPTGAVTRFHRDAAGALTSAVDPAGGVQHYEHDEAGRLIAFTDALGRRLTVDHDANGRVVGHTDPDGTQRRYERDRTGRIVAFTDAAGDRIAVTYDATGRPVRLGSDGHTIELDYDPAGRLASRSVDGRTHTYAREGRDLAITTPEGRTTTYERDRAGRVVAIDDTAAGRAALTRDAAGRPLRLVAPELERRWTWDDDGRLTRLEQTLSGRRTRHEVERDAAGRIVALTEGSDDPGATGGGGTARFGYDLAGQLTDLTLPDGRTWRFTYEHGRRTHEVGPDGAERTFRYDAAGQLVAIDGPDGTTRLVHDQLGRRTRRDDPDGTATVYGWRATGRLGRIDRTAPDGTTTTIRLTTDASGDLVAVDGIDLDWDHATGLPTVDRAGDVDLVDGGAAHTVGDLARWTGADPFGTPTGLDLPTSLGLTAGQVPLTGPVGRGMRGEITIDGLVWLRARVYDPDTGGFLSPDPLAPTLGSPQVANPYHYAGNDPANRIDPWGLQPLTDADLAAYNDQASRGLATRVGDGFSNFAADPFGWAADNWEGIVTVGLVVAGGVMIATGFGAPIGVGLIAGATLSSGAQIAMTGEVDGRATMISTIGGGLSGGAGGLFSSAPLVTRIGAGALTDGTISAGSQYALTGQISASGVMIDSLIGAGAAGAGGRVDLHQYNVDAAAARAAADGAPPAVVARQQQLLDGGVGYNISPQAWFDEFPTIGRNGTFTTDGRGISDALGRPVQGSQSFTVGLTGNGSDRISYLQLRRLEQGMGLEPASLRDGFRLTEVSGLDARAPRSPLEGNDWFRGPGQGLPNGSPELVIDSVPTQP